MTQNHVQGAYASSEAISRKTSCSALSRKHLTRSIIMTSSLTIGLKQAFDSVDLDKKVWYSVSSIFHGHSSGRGPIIRRTLRSQL